MAFMGVAAIIGILIAIVVLVVIIGGALIIAGTVLRKEDDADKQRLGTVLRIIGYFLLVPAVAIPIILFIIAKIA